MPTISREQIIKTKLSKGQSLLSVNGNLFISINEAILAGFTDVAKHRIRSRNLKFSQMFWTNNEKIIIDGKVKFKLEI